MEDSPIRKVIASTCQYVLHPLSLLFHNILIPALIIPCYLLLLGLQALDDRTVSGKERKRILAERNARELALPPQVRGMYSPPDGVTWDELESTSDFMGLDFAINCAAHEDGCSLVIFSRDERDFRDAARHMARVYDVLFGPQPYTVTEMQRYEANSRIVKRVCNIRQGLRVVRPGVGSLSHVTLPSLSWEASPGSGWIDLVRQPENDLLSLYYRWALHAISAIDLCHRKGVYLQVIDSSSFWIESDFSLVLAGLAQAQIPAPREILNAYHNDEHEWKGGNEAWKYDFDNGEWRRSFNGDDHGNGVAYEAAYNFCLSDGEFDEDEQFLSRWEADTLYPEHFWLSHMEHHPDIDSSAKQDIFQWATFVMGLFTNDLARQYRIDITTSDWSLCTATCPPGYDAHRPGHTDVPGFKVHDEADWLLNLRPEQLRSVVVKALKGEFKSASEVLVELRQALKNLGRVVDEHDDVSPGLSRNWSDIFIVVKGNEGEYREDCDPVWAREIKFAASHFGTGGTA